MILAIGTKFGPYELLALLGAGGMGEVYRARDTRLDRIVAIKVLLSGVTANRDLRARFEREARAISALSNPHICALYDLGTENDVEYLVMEYLDGETLADRIARGPLPTSQVVRYGVQIAEALQHAHRAGITHRDLKPGNVMITSSGAKLLDFGLAKFRETARVFSDDSAPPTTLQPLTAEGMIVGTIQYMAPEQLEGKPGDPRADIFALGLILYEMATAQRPFGGASRAGVIAAILSDDPTPLRSRLATAPAALERIINTALEKDPDERWQTAQDVARQLRWLTESSATSTEQLTPARKRHLPLALIVMLTALLAAAATWGLTRFFRPASHPQAARLQYSPPEDGRFVESFDSRNFALSPDGSTLCLVLARGGSTALFVRRWDSLDVKRVEGSEGASAPFWSSDSEWIGFGARGRLWKTRVAGGASPVALCDIAASGALATWQGKTILLADRPGGRGEIYRISDGGGKPERVTELRPGEWRHGWPLILPDGEHFLYQAFTADSVERRLVLASLEDPRRTDLLKSVSQASLVAPDQLLYVRDGKLLAQRFNAGKGVMEGEPALVADDVSYFFPTGRAEFDSSPKGTIVYLTNLSTGRLVSVDRRGGTARVIDEHGPFFDLSLSPDGKQAAVTVLDRKIGVGDIWIYDLARAVRDRFTSEPGLEVDPVWLPDGRSIVYSEAEGGSYPHMVRRALGATDSEALMKRGEFQFAGSFSPDGSSLFYTRSDPHTRGDIFRLDLRTGTSRPVVNSSFDEDEPRVSPDGRWLAFTSDATGSAEIYVRSLDSNDAAPIRISASGGTDPNWRHDGHELFYLSPGLEVMSAMSSGNENWTDTAITTLFRAPSDTRHFAAAPDGQSFVLLESAPGPSDSLFNVVLGWR